jgi:hypothetical protein
MKTILQVINAANVVVAEIKDGQIGEQDDADIDIGEHAVATT